MLEIGRIHSSSVNVDRDFPDSRPRHLSPFAVKDVESAEVGGDPVLGNKLPVCELLISTGR